MPLESELLAVFDLTVDKPIVLDNTPSGRRLNVNVTGGTFEGPDFRGEVLQGGGDWLVLRADGSLRLDVRATLRTHDGALVYMTYFGVRHGPEDVMRRLNAGETVDPSEYYFRIAPFFETGAPEYAWLNGLVCVGKGDREPTGPTYEVYRIL